MSVFFFQVLFPVLLGVLVLVMMGLAIYSTVRSRRRDRQAVERRACPRSSAPAAKTTPVCGS